MPGPAAVPGPAQIREDKVMMAVRGTSAAIICTASNAAHLMCGRWLRRAGVRFEVRQRVNHWTDNHGSRSTRRDGAKAEGWLGASFQLCCVVRKPKVVYRGKRSYGVVLEIQNSKA